MNPAPNAQALCWQAFIDYVGQPGTFPCTTMREGRPPSPSWLGRRSRPTSRWRWSVRRRQKHDELPGREYAEHRSKDPSTERLIDRIEEQIRNATICLADITTNNPNVWYELGYAFAVGRLVILVCSTERRGKIPEQPVIEAKQVVPTRDLTLAEASVLRIAAGETTMPGTSVTAWSVRHKAIRRGQDELRYGVAIQSLKRKGLVELYHGRDENGEYEETVTVTDSGWTWLEGKAREDDAQLTEEDIPF